MAVAAIANKINEPKPAVVVPQSFLNSRWYIKTIFSCDCTVKSLAAKISLILFPIFLVILSITLILDLIAKNKKPPIVPKRFSSADNIAIYHETMKAARTNYGLGTDQLVARTCIRVDTPYSTFPSIDSMKVYVVNKSTMRTAQDLVKRGLHPLVLNMANADIAGGGTRHGATAQEEVLCRQSNLMYGLLKMEEDKKFPIPEKGGILIPQVTFFRADPIENYEFLSKKEVFNADVFALAAYSCGGGGDRPVSDDDYRDGMTAKIENYLNAAIQNGNDSIVASALGCGVFANDPVFVAGLFKEILEKPQFKGQFREVAFGIIGSGSAVKNFQVFNEILNKSGA